jgi:phosphoenolpyruvate carboxykinase (GTP)
MPEHADLDLTGLSMAPTALGELLALDLPAWRSELAQLGAELAQYGARLPRALDDELNDVRRRLG